MKTVNELWQLLDEADRLPYGAGQIALVEQVLRHADSTGDRELMFATRIQATEAYVTGGDRAKSFVTFSWSLTDLDREPAPFHQQYQHSLLWQFKHMVGALTQFPEIPLARTYAVLNDMERRYRESGHTQHAVHMHRYLVADHIGDDAAADRFYEQWTTTPRDALSDCAGCDPSTRVDHLSDRGRYDEAVELAEPVLAGRLTCREQPQTILTALLEPYVRTGRLEQAADAHRRSYRRMRPHRADLWGIGDHLGFCARTGNEHRGLEILQRHIDWLDAPSSPAAGMNFAAPAALLLRRLTGLGHGGTKVHRRGKEDITAAQLAEELAAYATGLALRFDARNGTDTQSRKIAATLEAELWPEFTLSASARKKPAQPRSAAAPERAAGPTLEAGPGGEAMSILAVAALPATLPGTPAELLDLGEQLVRDDRPEELEPVLAAYDEHFGWSEPEATLAARRAELEAAAARTQPQVSIVAVRTALRFARSRWESAGDVTRALKVGAELGIVHAIEHQEDDAFAQVDAFLAHAEKSGDVGDRALAHARRGTVLRFCSRPAEALADVDEAVALATQDGDLRSVARFEMGRADVLGQLDRRAEAAGAVRAALKFYREHGPRQRVGIATFRLGDLQSDPATRVELFGAAIETGAQVAALDSRVGRARALLQLERSTEAIDDYVEAVALCTEQQIERGSAFLRAELARAYDAAGRSVEAAEVAEEAVTALTVLGEVEAALEARFLLAGIYRDIGDNEAAITIYTDLLSELTPTEHKPADAEPADAEPADAEPADAEPVETGLATAEPAADQERSGRRAQVREVFGDLLYRLDRDAEAAELFGAAATDLSAVGDQLGEVRLLRRRVAALHWADDLEAAEVTVATAAQRIAALPAELSEQPQGAWERAMFGFEAGRLFNVRERSAEALPHITGAGELLRSVGAIDEAERADVLLGQALLGAGRADEAAAVLGHLLDGMDPDARNRRYAAYELATALDALGRDHEASTLREREGLTTS